MSDLTLIVERSDSDYDRQAEIYRVTYTLFEYYGTVRQTVLLRLLLIMSNRQMNGVAARIVNAEHSDIPLREVDLLDQLVRFIVYDNQHLITTVSLVFRHGITELLARKRRFGKSRSIYHRHKDDDELVIFVGDLHDHEGLIFNPASFWDAVYVGRDIPRSFADEDPRLYMTMSDDDL